ncbi:hypothetical protein BN1080_02709 [Planococcus massiliensis]|uniref:Uncharacterized protein n=1 Tax=Planococcus massiliensis TaxID=1499687 RepID=A0A098EPH3_9BACL|nr:hypothetical protein BN1080_02709 [Planococcus massiliensis]
MGSSLIVVGIVLAIMISVPLALVFLVWKNTKKG